MKFPAFVSLKAGVEGLSSLMDELKGACSEKNRSYCAAGRDTFRRRIAEDAQRKNHAPATS
jgi:hypothetical protein